MNIRKEAEFTAENLERIKQSVRRSAELPGAASSSRSKWMTRSLARRMGITASVVLALVVATGAVNATGLFDLTRVLGFVGADRIGLLKEVNQSSEDQGIVMNVLGAFKDGDSAEIYVTLKDTRGNRIDKTLDTYDFFIEGASSHNAQTVHYDPKTGQATVRFLVTGDMKNRMTIRITSFLRGAQRQEHYDSKLDLVRLLESRLDTQYETLKRSEDVQGISGPGMLEMNAQEELHVLPMNEMSVPLPGMDWLKISNLGFVDGKLHIQWNREGDMARYNHGYLYFLEDEGDEKLMADYSVSRGRYNRADGGWAGDYEEHIFNISSLEQLQNLNLRGYFVEYAELVQGSWEVTFDLNQISKTVQGTTDFEWGDAIVRTIEVSPLGVTLAGSRFDQINWTAKDAANKLNLVVHFKDGTAIQATDGFIQNDGGSVKWMAPETLSLDNLASVSLNGQSVIMP